MRYKNNPFNIRYNGFNRWIGLIGNDNGFCEFESLDYGIRAAIIILRSYRKKNINTISTIINRFAPSSENNTQKYIKFVSVKSTIPSNSVICRNLTYAFILQAMAEFESHTHINISTLYKFCCYYKLCPDV